MKALILGRGGQLARALVKTAPANVEVRAVGRELCDITDEASVVRLVSEFGPDFVFNAAAYTAVDKAETERQAAIDLNAVAPRHVGRASKRAGAKFIHVSTDFVFDGQSSTPWKVDDRTHPINFYGQTKLLGEQEALAAAPGAIVVRTAWLYDEVGANFVNTVLRLLRDGGEVRIVADQVGTPTYAASLAAALWKLAALNCQGIYHYTDSGVASWYDFAVAVQEEAALLQIVNSAARIQPISFRDYPTAATRPSYSVLDKSEAWKVLGAASHWRQNLRLCLRERLNG